jgi:hypothetical protein
MGNLLDSPEAAAYRDLLKKLLEFHDTDAGNAESFELLHGEEFRHDCTHGKWLMWNGNYWETDETGQAERDRKSILSALWDFSPERFRREAGGSIDEHPARFAGEFLKTRQ